MRVIGVIGALMFAIGTVCAAASTLGADWRRQDLSPEERTALVERSEGQPFEEVAPLILRMLVDYQPRLALNIVGGTPWDDDHLGPREKTYVMAFTVWNHFMATRDDPPTAKVVLSLLQEASTSTEKTILVGAMWSHQWCPDAEETLRHVAENDEEDLGVRTLAAATLLYRCELNAYMPLAMQLVSAHEQGLSRCQAFDLVTNMGNRLFRLNKVNRQKVLRTGFGILKGLPEAEMERGCVVACRLGFLLEVPDRFQPDQNDPRYRGEYRLKAEFYVDTVKNALEWYAEHMDEMAGDGEGPEQAPAPPAGGSEGQGSPAEGG
jgi:hypothetical protein